MLSNYIKSKEPERQKLNEQIEKFLAQGNKIEVLHPQKEDQPSRRVQVNELF